MLVKTSDLRFEKRNDWQQWKDKIWDSMTAAYGYCGLAILEQYTVRSNKEGRCIECGAKGTHKQKSHLIRSVDHYWFCDECAAYWEKREKEG